MGKQNDMIYQAKQNAMKKKLALEAQLREERNKALAAEDDIARANQLNRKKMLAEQQFKDQQDKSSYRNQIETALKNKNDFHDSNVLSYLYE